MAPALYQGMSCFITTSDVLSSNKGQRRLVKPTARLEKLTPILQLAQAMTREMVGLLLKDW